MDSSGSLAHRNMTENRDDDNTRCAVVTIESCPPVQLGGQAAAEKPLETGVLEESPFSDRASGRALDVKALAPIPPTGAAALDGDEGGKGWQGTKDVSCCAEPIREQEIVVVEQTTAAELSAGTADGTRLASAKDAKKRRRKWWNPLRWLCGAERVKQTKRPVKHVQVMSIEPSDDVDQDGSCPMGRGTDRTGTRPHIDHCSVEFTCDTSQTGTTLTEDKGHLEQDQGRQDVSCPADEGGPETTETRPGGNITVSDGDEAVEQTVTATASSITEDGCSAKVPVLPLQSQEPLSESSSVNVVEEQVTQDESCAAHFRDGIAANTEQSATLAAVTEPISSTERLSSAKEEPKNLSRRRWWNPFSWPGKKSETAREKPVKRAKKSMRYRGDGGVVRFNVTMLIEEPTEEPETPVEWVVPSPAEVEVVTTGQTGMALVKVHASCLVAHADDDTTRDIEGTIANQTESLCVDDDSKEKMMQKPIEGDEICAP